MHAHPEVQFVIRQRRLQTPEEKSCYLLDRPVSPCRYQRVQSYLGRSGGGGGIMSPSWTIQLVVRLQLDLICQYKPDILWHYLLRDTPAEGTSEKEYERRERVKECTVLI